MKFFDKSIFILFLLATVSLLAVEGPEMSGCPRPPQGPPGPTGPMGPPGPPGPGGAVIFASAYTISGEDEQPVTTTYTDILFETDRLLTGIVHSSPGDFTIVTPGIYYMAWTFTLVFPGESTGQEAEFRVVVNDVAVSPQTFEAQSLISGSFAEISGSVLLPLAAGDVVSLQAISLFSDDQLFIENPSIQLMFISSAP